MICPQCGSSEIRSSKSTRVQDVIERVRGRDAFRCRQCRNRFFASDVGGAEAAKTTESKGSSRPKKLISSRFKKTFTRRLTVISIFAVAAIVFWFFLRYLTTERSPSQDSGAVTFHATCSHS